jgi:hypothetical protein
MVEIAAALSMAGSAYNMIKNGIEKGQEINDLYQGFSRFFDAKEELAEAAIANSNPSLTQKLFSGKSVEAQALEVTAARHKMLALEKELREFLIYTGQMDFYEDMMRERRKIRQQRLELAKRRAESRRFWTDVSLIAGFLVFTACVIGGMIALIAGA